MEQYYTIHKFAKMLGVTPQTLRNWDMNGKLHPHHTSGNGYRYYSNDQLNALKNPDKDAGRVTIGYCRVSSHKQKDDLERQVDVMRSYLTAQGKPFKIVTDIGSGINYDRKGLKQLMAEISENKVNKIVVLYKDGLVRYGFELIEYMAWLHHCAIEVIDHTDETEQQELVEDLVQIITIFSCRLQGKRARKAKRLIKELTEKDGEDND